MNADLTSEQLALLILFEGVERGETELVRLLAASCLTQMVTKALQKPMRLHLVPSLSPEPTNGSEG